MKASLVYQSQYVSASELKPNTPYTIGIRRVDYGEFDDDRGQKRGKLILVIEPTTAKAERGIILNKTQVDDLVTIFGSDETEDWHGRSVRVQSENTKYKGKDVLTLKFYKQ